ncbi:3-carboxy-cis,cis-muconate cycloisomerase [Candidatus Pelagisphaera phototrophica]|uniref:3-carboxy-cis,cis-muconate cycloisomerase n=1 Tax=Candidatus Pelagisphaera phototrophica TaxID=2684113 RepID=UPI0019E25E54|nr:3-carboxy-cis,cis-muconate cycloisomerase [Candidatus Pelagisphaera phototrophica]QXD32892.1 3-carboxy-cis,cis-muconate cycloisomerase [Candidatus Pelagisphaera phototrophica]
MMNSSDDRLDVLSSEQRLKAMLVVEAALAVALHKSGIISEKQADAISEACASESFDANAIYANGSKSGTPVIPLVKEIVAHARSKSEEAARFVHFGATSQDILDTATVLQLQEVVSQICRQLLKVESAFVNLAEEHSKTIALGRTLLQPGPPISFGLKVASWKAAVRRCRQRLETSASSALVLQFGGAVGNLSSLDKKGMHVAKHLAEELELPLPDAPWHAHRDRLVELASATGILVGSLGKIARDISLHCQGEVGELREASTPVKGGSSAMPHKRNPVGCMRVLAAANQAPGLVSSLLSAMPQEHERGLGGWQSEWPTLKTLFAAAELASVAMVEVSEGLEVDVARMKANLDATQELIFSERLSSALLPKLGRLEAQKLVGNLVAQSIEQDRPLSRLASEEPTIQSALDEDSLERVFDIEQALGSSEELLIRLLKRKRS